MTPPSDLGIASLDGWDDNVWASSSSSSHNRTLSSTLIDTSPPRSSHTLHRRRPLENVSTPSRPGLPWMVQNSRAEPSDSIRGHPLKRDSGGVTSSAFNDPTVTRPILNLWLSPSQEVDTDKDPSEAEHEVGTVSGEKEELVLIHEVSSLSMGI